jgi:hypothetical protein
MSPFYIAVGLAAVVAIVFGFKSGLLRSAATIVAYLCAAPFAVKGTALVMQAIESLRSGSQLRPMFSLAAQWGLKSLPPEVASFIDQIKSRRQI